MIKVLLAEDHVLVRNGIRMLLEKEPGIEIVDESNNGSDIVKLHEDGTVADVILADVNTPGMNGIEIASYFKNVPSAPKVLILSMQDNESDVSQALSMGANGYLLKTTSHDELVFAVKHVAAGNKYICSEVVAKLFSNPIHQNGTSNQAKTQVKLSKREMEVLLLIAEGHTNNEIAGKLFTSRRTVEGHRKNLIEKTGARNTAALIRFAVTNGLLK